jgi:hypothetical protein
LTPQKNGVSERCTWTIIERIQAMTAECNLPTFLWTKAIHSANYLVNRSPRRAKKGATPEQLYIGKIPDIGNLQVFGCIAYLHVPKENRKKLDTKTKKCIFVGYDEQSKVYRVYDPTKKKIALSRDIVFDESLVGYQHILDNSINHEDPFPLGSLSQNDTINGESLE